MERLSPIPKSFRGFPLVVRPPRTFWRSWRTLFSDWYFVQVILVEVRLGGSAEFIRNSGVGVRSGGWLVMVNCGIINRPFRHLGIALNQSLIRWILCHRGIECEQSCDWHTKVQLHHITPNFHFLRITLIKQDLVPPAKKGGFSLDQTCVGI